MELKKAQRKKVKLKIGFSGASGFGKTYSALLMAYGVTGDWSKIAVIDSENASADLYSDLGDYNTLTLKAPFSPERYIEAIEMCENAGIEVIIIDSITHEWDGVGGCLNIAEKLTAASSHKNSYIVWGRVTPRHKAFINAILQSPCHIFTTVRRKQEYDMSKNSSGRTIIQKVGTKEITREGFEYELTINFEFESDKHYVKASKDRTGLFMSRDPFIITSETGKELLKWANSGVDETKYVIDSINGVKNREELITIWNNNQQFKNNPDILTAFNKMAKTYPSKK